MSDLNNSNLDSLRDSLHAALVRIAVLETQLEDTKMATKIQADEYERRLSELNHAHVQATADKLKFVNIDLFYSKLDEFAKWRSDMEQRASTFVNSEMYQAKLHDREQHFQAIERRLAEMDVWRSRIIGIGIGGGLAGGAIGGVIAKLFE